MLNLICIYLHMRFLLQCLYMTVILSCFQMNLSIWINLNDAFHADCIYLEVNTYVFMFQIYKESLQLYVFGLSSIIKDSRTLKFLKYEHFYSLSSQITLVVVETDPRWFVLNVVFQGNCWGSLKTPQNCGASLIWYCFCTLTFSHLLKDNVLITITL